MADLKDVSPQERDELYFKLGAYLGASNALDRVREIIDEERKEYDELHETGAWACDSIKAKVEALKEDE